MFEEISVYDLNINPFTAVGKQWLLISAGTEGENNLMTASWGMMGILWRMPMAQIFIRPTRHTKKFVDDGETVALSFLPEQYREALNLCGTLSGRDTDKWAAAGLTPVMIDGTPAVAEAELILLCRKQYSQWVDPACFIDPNIDGACYPKKDYHEMYMCKIEKVLKKI